jgi:multidrug efflux pump subunit AcrA (membrane-fusion protein)
VNVKKSLIVNGVLVLAVAGAAAGAYAALGSPTAAKATPVTAIVSKGAVLSSVSATGNVISDRQLSLNFTTGGKLTEVDVKPGDKVTAGQVVAKIDDRTAQQTLASAKASLTSAKAKQLQDQQGLTPAQATQDEIALEQSQAQIDVAQAALDTAKTQADVNATGYQAAIDQARTALDATKATASQNAVQYQTTVDQAANALAATKATVAQNAVQYQTTINQAQAQLATDQATLATDQSTLATDQATQSTDAGYVATDQSDQSNCQSNPSYTPTRKSGETCSDVANQLQTDQTAYNQATSTVNSDTTKVNGDTSKVTQDSNSVTNATNNQAAGLIKDQQSVDNSNNSLTNAKNSQAAGIMKDQQSIANGVNAITSAINAQTAGLAKDQQSIANAQNSLNSANLSLRSTKAGNAVKEAPATAATVAGDDAGILSAQTAVDNAQKTVDDTVLTAPTNGTVVSVSNGVGENVGSGGTSSSSSSSGASASANSSSSSGSGFIVLTDLAGLQVKAGFSEADAAKVKVGEPVTVTFDALPGQSASGSVISIDTTSTVVSNVVTYNVVAVLAQAVTGVKPGMTASMQVIINEKDNVVKVPTASVSGAGSASSVRLMENGKEVTKQVVAGLRGDDSTEIVSGLVGGETLVISNGARAGSGSTPSVTTRVPAGAGGFGGGGGGGGGVRFGGG